MLTDHEGDIGWKSPGFNNKLAKTYTSVIQHISSKKIDFTKNPMIF